MANINKEKKQHSKNEITIYELVENHNQQIKEAITKRFLADSDDLFILSEDKDGVYLSEEDLNMLCCLVVDKKNGFLYVVTSNIKNDGENLENFQSAIVP